MPRKPRLHFPGAFYHCLNRGNQRRQIYCSDDDFLFMLGAVANDSVQYYAFIYAYCLMHNSPTSCKSLPVRFPLSIRIFSKKSSRPRD